MIDFIMQAYTSSENNFMSIIRSIVLLEKLIATVILFYTASYAKGYKNYHILVEYYIHLCSLNARF